MGDTPSPPAGGILHLFWGTISGPYFSYRLFVTGDLNRQTPGIITHYYFTGGIIGNNNLNLTNQLPSTLNKRIYAEQEADRPGGQFNGKQ